jgi:large subunit ribosomal protein L9
LPCDATSEYNGFMKVILTSDVPGIGRAGDIKEVSDGYARNFLMRQNKAVPASQSQVDKIQKENKEKDEKKARETAKALKLQKDIQNRPIIFKRKANGDKLFAAIHEQDIINEIKLHFGVELKPKQVRIPNPIKAVGSHQAQIKLTDNNSTPIKIIVEAQ